MGWKERLRNYLSWPSYQARSKRIMRRNGWMVMILGPLAAFGGLKEQPGDTPWVRVTVVILVMLFSIVLGATMVYRGNKT